MTWKATAFVESGIACGRFRSWFYKKLPCFVGKVGEFVLFTLVLSKALPYIGLYAILALHSKVCALNS